MLGIQHQHGEHRETEPETDPGTLAGQPGGEVRGDVTAIQNLVLYGTATPSEGAMPFAGLAAAEVVVGNQGCPGVECRVSVAIPGHGIQSTEPVEEF